MSETCHYCGEVSVVTVLSEKPGLPRRLPLCRDCMDRGLKPEGVSAPPDSVRSPADQWTPYQTAG